MSRYSKSNDGLIFGGGCLFIIILFLVLYIPIVLWTDSNLDFYLTMAKGHPVDVPMWISAVCSLFEPIVLLDVIGSLVRLIL